jgi:hypothetical protein
MSRFATPDHLLSCACMCPRNDESARKRRVRLHRGGKWLKTTLVQAARSAVKAKDSYLQAQSIGGRSALRPGRAKVYWTRGATRRRARDHPRLRPSEHRRLPR